MSYEDRCAQVVEIMSSVEATVKLLRNNVTREFSDFYPCRVDVNAYPLQISITVQSKKYHITCTWEGAGVVSDYAEETDVEEKTFKVLALATNMLESKGEME